MALEQLHGHGADAGARIQFGFCVSFYESLYGVSPVRRGTNIDGFKRATVCFLSRG
jgi:hypothetical protein